MDNQHQKIKGYRELAQVEIDLMNRIKDFGPQFELLLADLHAHINKQISESNKSSVSGEYDPIEMGRLAAANPLKWANSGATDIQKGLMSLTRSIAQPTFF